MFQHPRLNRAVPEPLAWRNGRGSPIRDPRAQPAHRCAKPTPKNCEHLSTRRTREVGQSGPSAESINPRTSHEGAQKYGGEF